MKTISYRLWAPTCAQPGCANKVTYHERTVSQDGSFSFHWKTFCEYHRTTPIGRNQRAKFIASRGGCENRDGRCGFTCADPNTPSLQIDHWDGDKHNNSPDNLVVLCANCHSRKTKDCGNFLKRYVNRNTMFDSLFDIIN